MVSDAAMQGMWCANGSKGQKPIHALIGCVRDLCRPATTLNIRSIPMDDLLWGHVRL